MLGKELALKKLSNLTAAAKAVGYFFPLDLRR